MNESNKTSTGSRLLSEEIAKREMSYQDVSQELLASGYDIQRYSVWQWAHGVSRPSLRNAFGLEAWSKGGIPARSWNEGGVKQAMAAVTEEKPAKKTKSSAKPKKVKP